MVTLLVALTPDILLGMLSGILVEWMWKLSEPSVP